MKAVLKFDLEDYFDKATHNRCVNATGAYLALYGMREYLREVVVNTENDYIKIDTVRDYLESLFEKYDINFNDLPSGVKYAKLQL